MTLETGDLLVTSRHIEVLNLSNIADYYHNNNKNYENDESLTTITLSPETLIILIDIKEMIIPDWAIRYDYNETIAIIQFISSGLLAEVSISLNEIPLYFQLVQKCII